MRHNKVAISIAGATIDRALERISAARSVADIIEFRLDYLTDLPIDDPRPAVARLIRSTDRPVILTYHPDQVRSSEGAVDVEFQRRFWQQLFPFAESRPVQFDLDIEVAEAFLKRSEPVPWAQVIVSYHNFEQTPTDLLDVYRRLAATPAGVLKIATMARDLTDNLLLLAVLERARREGRPTIALGMGEAGVISRILAPTWGSFLTFGSLTAEEATAPGQLTARELISLYRVPQLTPDTHVTGVIGNPVSHSLSPRMHNEAFKRLHLNWVYLPLLVKDLRRFMTDFVHPSTRKIPWSLRGLSVTIPHKVAVVRYLDRVDETARAVGAVNTVVIEGNRLVGYNSDVVGALRPLQSRLDLRGARVVILGAGGAARAVVYALRRAEADVLVLARRLDRAEQLAQRFGVRAGHLSDVAGIEYDILINATPVGLENPDRDSIVPSSALRPGTIVFDLVPIGTETRLLREARRRGCRTISGLEMLVHQAAVQFQLWTRHRAPLSVMWEAIGESERVREH
ncbi:MAG: shikimate dehydrogenase [Acidobacteria bacterium]|nr:MAG: shikimate dehydrogenase [Acidobacteriota bacterium]